MKKYFIVLFLASVLALTGSAQDVIKINGKDCGPEGSAKRKDAIALNILKNRYKMPSDEDYDKSVTIKDLLKPGSDVDRFLPDKAVEVTAYVYDVKSGGKETCNCGTSDPMFMDTHIELTLDDVQTAKSKRVIAEVTPRIRQQMAQQGIDWSTDNLQKTLKGHLVKVSGWLLFDAMHTANAANTNPDAQGRTIWRATCWEIHPITAIQLLDGPLAEEQDGEEGVAPLEPIKTTYSLTTNEENTMNGSSNPSDVLAMVLLGAILGMAGQGARVIVGLKKANDAALKENATMQEVFELKRLVLSLLYAFAIGGIAGVFAAVESVGGGFTKSTIFAFLAAGYAGTDFIEGFVNKNLKKGAPGGSQEGLAKTGTSTKKIRPADSPTS